MASPGFIAICCLGNKSNVINGDIFQNNLNLENGVVSVISLIFAVASSVGILALIFPWRDEGQETSPWKLQAAQSPSLHHVMKCVIVAGILANVGIIVRSSGTLDNFYPPPEDTAYGDSKHVFCIFTSVWIQYFFLCVIFWHLVYGLEFYLISVGSNSSYCTQHFIGWVIPAALCGIGTWEAYQPTIEKCGSNYAVNRGILYLIMLGPVIVVALLLLVLCCKATAAVRRSLINNRGTYSTVERDIVDRVQIKFILIVIAFTVCWIPNIMNGIIVSTMEEKSGDITLVFLVLESVLNPFQVLIDALVLYGWPASMCQRSRSRHRGYQPISSRNINDLQRSGRSESDSLISFSNRHRSDM